MQNNLTQKEIESVLSSPLFAGIAEGGAALAAVSPQVKEYSGRARILCMGERCTQIGALLSGEADIVKEDAGGDPVTVAKIAAGELFAEAFAFSGAPLTVSVFASPACRVLWMRGEKVAANGALAANALRVFAQKNIFLTQRVEHLSRHTLQEKLLSYLSSVRRATGSDIFAVPFDRQGLADYLGCDRSALSFVLSKLRRGGVLDYHKNVFRWIGERKDGLE